MEWKWLPKAVGGAQQKWRGETGERQTSRKVTLRGNSKWIKTHTIHWTGIFTYILLISAAKIGINIADMGPMGQRNTFMNLKSAAQCQRILIFETRKHHQNFELCWKILNGQKNLRGLKHTWHIALQMRWKLVQVESTGKEKRVQQKHHNETLEVNQTDQKNHIWSNVALSTAPKLKIPMVGYVNSLKDTWRIIPFSK